MSTLHGWGRYPRVAGTLDAPDSGAGWSQALRDRAPLIVRGLGRSYGDSALGPHVVATRWLDRFQSFDPATGALACDAGVSLDDILRLAIPHGWFLPVTPGTRFVTVGGAVASDVHGKDHHANGTFCMHLRHLDMLLGNGEQLRVSPTENADLFHATCGGMGLTGVILGAALQLKRIPSSVMEQTTLKLPALDALLEAFDAEAASSYSVAWIDCIAGGAQRGRSLLMLGEHAAQGPLAPPSPPSHRLRFDLPRGRRAPRPAPPGKNGAVRAPRPGRRP
ncbi:FAD-binding oxidoreductase, partial [uncultured Ramlibacter sp.]|uniref:FAD-binding oxidoreductase n=1 Tax=uncultured Ramlibacter sp. TaxID=260755 RepID=UPI00260D8DCB